MTTVLYVGTGAGLVTLRGSDATWEVASESLAPWGIEEICVVPGESGRVYVGTRGDGVWTSEDAGESWHKPSRGRPGPGKVRCVTVDAHDPNVVYAGCEPIDIYVSQDKGKNWERLTALWDIPGLPAVNYPVASVEPHVRDITLDPRDSQTFYAALQIGYAVKTTDAGRTWKVLNEDGVDCDVHTIVVDSSQPDRVLLATGGDDARKGRSKGKALYASEDGGETWQGLAMSFPQDYSIPLTPHPSDPAIMYSALAKGAPPRWRRETGAEGALIRSQDGGRTWQEIDLGAAGSSKQFAEAITIDPAQPEHVFAGFRSGEIIASTDAGASWTKLPLTMPTEITDLEVALA